MDSSSEDIPKATEGLITAARDADQIYAGTTTGGRGSEEPGRVSDSATVAGNYASYAAGVSATGTLTMPWRLAWKLG